jgi:adenosylcobinamide-GDP ribazoletransferase
VTAGIEPGTARPPRRASLVRFFSRLPVPALPFEADPHAVPNFRTAPLLIPVVGLIVGLPGALALWCAAAAGLPALMAAGIALAVTALATGGFHEDGLADSFDGLGGGRSVERRLEIMRDSRIGSFGGTALILGLLLRASGIAGLLQGLGPWGAALVMVAAAILSRTLAQLPMTVLPPARIDGAAATAWPVPAVFAAGVIQAATTAGLLCHIAGAGLAAPAAGALAGLGLAGLMTVWAWRTIGGHTGDIAGACQQLAEIGFYAGMLALLGKGPG